MSVEDQLQREAAGARMAAIAAIGAIALQLVAQLVATVASRDAPSNTPGAILATPAFYRDHALGLIAAAVVLGGGYLLTGLALGHLYRATKFRRPETPRIARICTYVGPALLAVGVLTFQVVVTVASVRYLARDAGDYFAAREITTSTPTLIPRAVGQAGSLALAFAFVLISLNAMRAGLLTRFMGVLGCIAGGLIVIPLGSSAPIVQWFWLGAVAALFLGRWPGGVPPAWRTGRAEPWPTARELRERGEQQASSEPRSEPEPELDPERESEPGRAPERGAHPSSRKRRRKKRR